MKIAHQKTVRMSLLNIPLRSIAIVLVIHLVFALSVNARTISVEEAKNKAQRFLSQNSKNSNLLTRNISASTFNMVYEAQTADKHTSCFYVLNQSFTKGYIIMSADDRLPEVLGYSDTGEFDINKIPDNMKWWLSEYERQIGLMLTSSNDGIKPMVETAHRAGWVEIPPLVKTKWNQLAPYNNLCPTINGAKTPTGCVATAMAQVMNYYQWPVTGRGSNSYEWNGQTLSMDFSEVAFDWENMQEPTITQEDSPETQNAVAALMYACGIGVNMDYRIGESCASFLLQELALLQYFNYDANYVERDDVELPEWENLIYAELINSRPILYGGQSSTTAHAFVCDGYLSDGLFHINWGWGGYCDGYFLLSVLNPEERTGDIKNNGGYKDFQKVVCGISPVKNTQNIIINAENFPDKNFRDYLLEQEYGKDGELIEAEIKRITSISVSGRNINSLKGIEYFTALTSLYCGNNKLTSLDLSSNIALNVLLCDDNELISLDVSGCAALTSLYCSGNKLMSLDVSGCAALTSLNCYNNRLTSLDVSGCTALTSLYCSGNELMSLDVSGCTALTWLECYENQLTFLDVSGCTALTSLKCYSNNLMYLNVSGCMALPVLECQGNELTSINLLGCTALTRLRCFGNKLTSLDVSDCTALTSLECFRNQLTSLDVSDCTAITWLECYENQLTSLDVSKNIALTGIACYRNQIKGVSMDNLIHSLPENKTSESYKFHVYEDYFGDEGNVCTKIQVAAVKAKGWLPCNSGGRIYEGSDDEPDGITIDEANFPDENFRAYLLEQDYGKDGLLTEEEIKGIANIDIAKKNISSLKGIEYFTALTALYCSYNSLEALDVSQNINLRTLDCGFNSLSALDVSKNTSLSLLRCDNNKLTELDVSQNTLLMTFYCSANQLTTLDVSKNVELGELRCHTNQLTTLDVSQNVALKDLKCYANKLTALDVSKNTALAYLDCSDNQIKGEAMDALISSLPQNMTDEEYRLYVYASYGDNNVCTKRQVAAAKAKGWTTYYHNGPEYEGSDEGIAIDETNFPDENFRAYLLEQDYGEDGLLTEEEIKGVTSINLYQKGNIRSLKGIEHFVALKSLNCSYNQLTELDVSQNTALTSLGCSGNQLTKLDISQNTALTSIGCDKNLLTSLDVSQNTALTSLSCGYNQLTELDVSKNTALTSLVCTSNRLTDFDISQNTALTQLYCDDNQLVTLDVSKNTALKRLVCPANQLTSLDVSYNTALTYLACGANLIATLNVSQNMVLEMLQCENNQLMTLDVSKNTALTELSCYLNLLPSLDVSKNTALTEFDCSHNQLTALDVSKNIALTELYCDNNQLTTLDISENTVLTTLYCSNNQIKDSSMDALISSLPQNATNENCGLYVYNALLDEGNVCTKTQVTAAKERGWTPYYYNRDIWGWTEYEGSDDEVVSPDTPVTPDDSVSVTSITLPELETIEVNGTIQLTPTIEPADAKTELTWASDDESIAKVSSAGLVIGIKAGTAIISVRTSNDLVAECFVVVQDVTGIKDVNADGSSVPVYNMAGQKVNLPANAKKGIYIVNGKKVVVK